MRTILAVVIAAFVLGACVTIKPQTTISRGPGWYTVKRSDTLYSIAWRYGLDYKELADWNNIGISDPIYPGQRLRLIKPPQTAQAENTGTPRTVPATPTQESEVAADTVEAGADTDEADQFTRRDPGEWIWPTEGKVLNTFHPTQLDRRGIDIAGEEGQAVLAVADGKVVYSGNGLSGYGNLIIIKHSDTFLSAYAYCRERLVQEGAAVEAGKIVAKMGSKDNAAKLHFEIRRNGKPVDPLKYLPKR